MSTRTTLILAAVAATALAVAIALLFRFPGGGRIGRMGTAEQQEVLATYDRTVAAAEALNLDELFGYVIDNDGSALALNGQLIPTRAAALERTRANFRGLAKIKYHLAERHVTMLAPDAAVLVAKGTNEVQLADGRSLTTAFVHTVVFVRRDGAWRVIHSHQSTPQ